MHVRSAALCLLLSLALPMTIRASHDPGVVVSIDTARVRNEVDPRFLSVGIGTRLVKSPSWEGFDVGSNRLVLSNMGHVKKSLKTARIWLN